MIVRAAVVEPCNVLSFKTPRTRTDTFWSGDAIKIPFRAEPETAGFQLPGPPPPETSARRVDKELLGE